MVEKGSVAIIGQYFEQLSRRKKQALALLCDSIALPAALWVAIALRLGEWSPDVAQFWPAFVVSALVCLPVFVSLGLYRQVIRYMGNHAMLAVLKGATITAIVIFAVAYIIPLSGFPRSVPIIFWMLVVGYVAATRFAVRAYFQWLNSRFTPRLPVIIYGAGSAGVELSRLIHQQGTYAPVAFIDDDARVQKRIINGIYVFSRTSLPTLLRDTQAKQVLVAVNSDPESRKRIIEFLEPFAVHVRLIPDLAEVIADRNAIANVRDVKIEDLLGRDAVEPLPHLLAGSVKNRSVLVTGAGGSIGSELCRQIVRQGPRALVLLDLSEYNLYQVQREIREVVATEKLDVQISTVLGSVLDRRLMERTFSRHRITTVYHAAAYKHVSLVEDNVIQGIKNNAFGTLYAAEAAIDAGVKDFILISTDKAVRTTNVMGASKRIAEMILQALQQQASGTRFSMVRFGNVLGSSGSVVPLFLEQIEHGGPVTVTHPEVTRYFMTIPEAAQLVLSAASMAKGGDVFLLDMGKPIKILDLANRMIRLKGYTIKDDDNPDGDIEIEFTGLNAGEKLHEELLVGAAASGTAHRKIMRAEESFITWSDLRASLNTLEQACDNFDYGAIKTFIEALVEGSDLEEKLGDLTLTAEVVALNPKNVSDS